MAAYPGDGDSIPFIKIHGTPEVAPQPIVRVHEDVYLLFELINMGTAPTRPGDEVTGYLIYSGGVIHQETKSIPTIEPNGGTWRNAFKFEGRYVMIEGEWAIGAMVVNANTIGEVQDDQRLTFQVSPAASSE